MKYFSFLLLVVSTTLFMSCQSGSQQHVSTVSKNNFFEVSDFDCSLPNNTEVQVINDSVISSFINLDDAMDGVEFPANGNKLQLKFKLQNISNSENVYHYKIIYQNESYKFNECDSNGNYNPYCSENFYGSWPDTSIHYKTTAKLKPSETIEITEESVFITGNPRFESRYIANGENNKWQRNPRVGDYRFYLLIWAENDHDKIPAYVKNIAQKEDSIYKNPIYYLQSKNISKPSSLLTILSKHSLNLKVQLKPENGIYIDPDYSGTHPIYKNSDTCCGQTEALKKSAHFQQFFHTIVSTTGLDNIPVISDVLKDNYTHLEYNWNKSFFKKEELIRIRPSEPKYACETVRYDSNKKAITIHNPKSTPGNWRKENTGVKTRHGFTYGKYRVKCKLTELLNKDQMWNGITNAIWLINQSNSGWNNCRPCQSNGYMSSYLGGEKDSRVSTTAYSEIDFEILKSYRYCPSNLFPPVYKRTYSDKSNNRNWNKRLPEELEKLEGSIMVNCTNWDMACGDPVNFKAGCNPIMYQGTEFQAHRWDTTYRATTISTPALDDDLFAAPYYYFEIEWKPEEIIWRIGPQPDKMIVVGYMNATVTSIPNNQMLLIIDQEFHNTKWWIGSPYSQDNIPFPKNDVTGDIFEVTIE